MSCYYFCLFLLNISIRGRKNRTCETKTLFTNFTRRNCFLQVWNNLLIVLKIRSHAKLTCIFIVNGDENKKNWRVVSVSASSLVVYCLSCNLNVLYLHDSTQCYKQRTTRPAVVRSPQSPYLKLPKSSSATKLSDNSNALWANLNSLGRLLYKDILFLSPRWSSGPYISRNFLI